MFSCWTQVFTVESVVLYSCAYCSCGMGCEGQEQAVATAVGGTVCVAM
jgi:hypothetical protein